MSSFAGARALCLLALAACAASGATSAPQGSGGDTAQSGGSSAPGAGGAGGELASAGAGAGGELPSSTCGAVDVAPTPVPCASLDIRLAAPFDAQYECFDLGDVPLVPKKWGGLNVHPSDPGALLLGGNANQASGALYTVRIARDASCHIVGFTGEAERFADAAYNDGGVAYGPSQVLFLARWPQNELGLLAPGSDATDKVIALTPLGVDESISGLGFVPQGFAGEGQLKALNYGNGFNQSGQWYSLSYEPDGAGLYDITSATKKTVIDGGPEGFVFIKQGNPQFERDSILVSEWNDGKIAAYELNAESDPIPDTRRDFLTGFSGPEGALLDPLSGDFLFSTFDPAKPDTDHAIVVRGFKPPPPGPK